MLIKSGLVSMDQNNQAVRQINSIESIFQQKQH